MTQFGDLVREHRIAAGMSMNALARVADIDPSYVFQIERGTKGRSPKRDVVLSICTGLKLDAGETDVLLYAVGLAATMDWRLIALEYRQRLRVIEEELDGVKSATLLVQDRASSIATTPLPALNSWIKRRSRYNVAQSPTCAAPTKGQPTGSATTGTPPAGAIIASALKNALKGLRLRCARSSTLRT